MAGYLFKTLNHSAPGAAANTNLFTVPAGHIYVVKTCFVRQANGAAAARAYQLEKSDNAGANFRLVDAVINIAANADLSFNHCAASGRVDNTQASDTPAGTLNNLIFEAGSILRIVNGANLTTAVEVSGLDYTI